MLLERAKNIIDPLEIIKMPYLELNEAIEIFHGIKSFPYILRAVSAEEQAYFQRSQIYFRGFHEPKVPSKLQKIIQESKIELRHNVNIIFEHPFSAERLNIKAIRPSYPVSPPPPLEQQILYFCRTKFLLYLALSSGIILHPFFQKTFGINQLPTFYNPLKTIEIGKISLQALAQLLWHIEENRNHSQGKIIELMKEIIFNSSYQGVNLRSSFVLGPPQIVQMSGKYFKEEKQNILRSLLKAVDPRPKKIKIGRPKLTSHNNSHPIKSIPGIFEKTLTSSTAIHYQKLTVAIQTIGHYLFALRLVDYRKQALIHPLISYYTPKNSSLINYANFSLETVLPEENTIISIIL